MLCGLALQPGLSPALEQSIFSHDSESWHFEAEPRSGHELLYLKCFALLISLSVHKLCWHELGLLAELVDDDDREVD